jgi:hypothetical protein
MSDEIKTVEATLVVKVQTWQDVRFRLQLVEEEDPESAAGRIWNVTRAEWPVGIELPPDSVGDLPDVILEGVGHEHLDAIGERAASESKRSPSAPEVAATAAEIVALCFAGGTLSSGKIWASIGPDVALADVQAILGSLEQRGLVKRAAGKPDTWEMAR